MSLKGKLERFEAKLARPGEIARESGVVTPSHRYEGRLLSATTHEAGFSEEGSAKHVGSVALLEKPTEGSVRQIEFDDLSEEASTVTVRTSKDN